MSNFFDEHLVGFESMPDLEDAAPGFFEREFTDVYGTELLHQQIGDGSEAYDHDVDTRQYHQKPRKIRSQKRIIVYPRHLIRGR